MERSGSQRRKSLSDLKLDAPNPNLLAGLTLTAVLENQRPPIYNPANQSLFDALRDDRNKKTWKLFREKLRLRRAGAAWVSSIQTPASDVPAVKKNNNTMISRRNSIRQATPESGHPEPNLGANNKPTLVRGLSRTTSLAASSHQGGSFDGEPGTNKGGVEEKDDDGDKGRMSLMALLAETDGSAYLLDDEDEEEEIVSQYSNCSVCMVRHNAAPSMACGHTYCKMCAREFVVEKANCPLCNRFVLEILDFF